MDAISFSPTLSRLKLPTHHHHHHRHRPRTLLHFPRLRLRRPLSAFFRDQSPAPTPDPSFGEVSRIIGSRTLPPPDADPSAAPTTEYLLEWKDGHPSSWCPASAIAADVLADYESPWWTAAKKPDPSALSSLLSDPAVPRDPDLLDADGRTALHFVAGLGCEDSIRALASGGADVDRPDRSGDGLAPLHMAAGYARPGAVRALLDAGADPAAADGKGRTALDLAKEVLAATPRAQLARRLTLEAVVRELEAAVYEFSEVTQVVEGRGKGERREYLVEWRDGGREWVKAAWVAEDLVRDYEAGLEYGVAEAVVGARPATEGRRELLVKWVDMQEETWEPEENVDAELVRDYDERMAKKQQQEESSAAVGSPQ